MLAAFAEVVSGPVADVGCGPGANTAYLKGLGVDVFGVDLSPEIVALSRERYPELRFQVGSMTALDLPDGELGGVTASGASNPTGSRRCWPAPASRWWSA